MTAIRMYVRFPGIFMILFQSISNISSYNKNVYNLPLDFD